VNQASLNPCTCGDPHPHEVATRRTADGYTVHAWSDGSLTWALGEYIRGSARPRTPEQQGRALRAARLVLDLLGFFDSDELPAVVAAARRAKGDRSSTLAILRGERGGRVSGLVPTWTTLEADRDGKPTLQVWTLPRMTHPGLAVWREKGLYRVMREMPGRRGTYTDTCFTARNYRELATVLETIRIKEVS